ncbi:TRAP transporter large permease [Nesterenkonia haasae]|uniref:TRAP transporter large permease n=1 Tax=Nesterenkonia haasae TaxID=2587813 RepID=UPI001390FCD6|nr:TRAP transporter large permease [Nesterenkonia haasae]NDK31936.1 TRAP transporter large permease [Nesterenkonia haasae]
MDINQVVILTLVILLVMLSIRMPVALSLGLAGGVGLILLRGLDYATSNMGSVPFADTASFAFTIIPMFILMGMFAVRANIATNVFAVANHFARKAPGGLGVATVMACAGFSAVSGSSIGTAATISRLAVNQMRASGFPATLATGIVAIAGTLGVMIPPSTFLVLYAVLARESVAAMLAAGIIPGLLSAVFYIVYIMLFGQRMIRKEMAHRENVDDGMDSSGEKLTAAVDEAREELARRATRIRDLPWRGVLHVAILFLIVMGGMYSGIFTSTEAAAVGALTGLIILIVEYRGKGIRETFIAFKDSLLDTAQTTSMVFFIVIGSGLFSAFLVTAGVTNAVANWVTSLDMNPMLIMGLLLLCLIPLGMFLESMSILVLSVPLLYPIAMEFGFEGIWLGIMIVKLIEIGMVTPPVGIISFVIAGSARVRAETVFIGVIPLLVMDLIITAILFFVPALTMFLPSLIR